MQSRRGRSARRRRRDQQPRRKLAGQDDVLVPAAWWISWLAPDCTSATAARICSPMAAHGTCSQWRRKRCSTVEQSPCVRGETGRARLTRADPAREHFAVARLFREGNPTRREILQVDWRVAEWILRHRAADDAPQLMHARPRIGQLCGTAQARGDALGVAVPALIAGAPTVRARQRHFEDGLAYSHPSRESCLVRERWGPMERTRAKMRKRKGGGLGDSCVLLLKLH